MYKIIYIRSTGIYDDSRATKELSALLEFGYDVTVLGWDRNGKSLEKCRKVFQGNKYIRFIFYDKQIENGAGLKKALALVSWNKWLKKQLMKFKDVNVVHACNLDSGLAALWYCKKYNCRLVYDIYDYYIDSHTIPNFLSFLIEKKEIEIINKSDITIICTEERREQISKAHPPKVIVIHNSPEISYKPDKKPQLDYIYCGTMNGGRLISEILDNYQYNSDVKMMFAGTGCFAEKAKNLDNKFPDFSYLGTIPYSDVLMNESNAIVISAIYSPEARNHRLCAPNKFYEALALGKPIIVCKGTGIDKIVEDNKIGIVINYDVEEFYNALRKLKDNLSECEKMGNKARILYEKNYSWAIMKNKLHEAYNQLVQEK